MFCETAEDSHMNSVKKRPKGDIVRETQILDIPKYQVVTQDIAQCIISYFENFRDIANAAPISRAFNQAAKDVRSLRCVCREIDHENARKCSTAKTSEDNGGGMPERDLQNNLRDISLTAEKIDVDSGEPHSPRGDVANQEQESWTAERNGADVSDALTSMRIGVEVLNGLNGDRIEHNVTPKSSEAENDCGRAPKDKALELRAAKETSYRREARQRATDNNLKGVAWKSAEYVDGYSSSAEINVSEVGNSFTCKLNSNDSRRKLDYRVALTDEGVSNQIIGVGSSLKSGNRDNVKEALDASSTVLHEECESSQRKEKILERIPFRQALEQNLRSKSCIQQLRIEIEPKLQSKSVPAEERELCDFWLSDPQHVKTWVPSVSSSLQHLCIVDYGQQAIVKQSSILKILSQHCKRLKSMDLRNMCIDTKECEQMPELTSFTLRCVKMNNDDALDDISSKMENLQTLALLGVFGILDGGLTLPHLKVLCLGLSSKGRNIKLDLPNLSKLQLKMACPDELSVKAPALKFIAFNLEVSRPLAIKFINISNLQELLYGASNFLALSSLVKCNRFLNKLFLDIPCMALGEDGKWLGVLKEIMLHIPSFECLSVECPNLETLNLGPGLWQSMETNIKMVTNLKRWPPVKTLILHMIPQTLVTCVTLLNKLRTEMCETLVNLEINIHTTSPVASNEFLEAIQDDVRGLNFTWKPWTKSLDFSCFTF